MHNAKGIAVKIHQLLGSQIAAACRGAYVPDSFLAALISVENAQLNPEAYRFEKHVFANLKRLRNPAVFWRRSWNGITQADLKGASDAALVNLATSFGLTQIMGWWAIRLKTSVSRIRDSRSHLPIAVQLLEITAMRYLKTHDYGSVLRIWNTGRPDGRTYHANYVPNALAVMQTYKIISAQSAHTSVPPRPTITGSSHDAPALLLPRLQQPDSP